nr:radical SAM protein [Methyloceanibacter marginalis]
MESSPSNGRLVYITRTEAAAYLDEIARDGWPVTEIGFTGGEPFMNPEILGLLEDALSRGLSALVLTNAMQPMLRLNLREGLLALREAYGDRLTLRVSLDHYAKAFHDEERGPGSFDKTLEASTGSRPTAFRCRSQDALAGEKPRPMRGPATPCLSGGVVGRSARTTRPLSYCSPRWTYGRRSPRSPRVAGAFSENPLPR